MRRHLWCPQCSSRLREGARGTGEHGGFWIGATAGVRELRPRPLLAAGVVVLGLAVTVESGTWVVGVPTVVRDQLERGAGGFSVVMVGYATGAITVGALLVRRQVRQKPQASLLAWTLYLPAYVLIGFAGTLPTAVAGAVLAGVAQASSLVLLNSAAQEQVPDAVLGRVMGLISLVRRGAHASGLVLVSPLFAVVDPSWMFAAAGVVAPLLGLGGLSAATLRSRETAARAPGSARSLRS
jgi:MFS family permease